MKLYDGKLDEELLITNVNILGKEQKRLFDLGILPGNSIKKTLVSIFNDPCAYEIKNTVIALRNIDAKNIEVENIYEQ
ncbi:MAG: FeoA family protein [Bacilli bacterium]